MITSQHPSERGHRERTDSDLFDLTRLTALIAQLSDDPLFLGRRLRDAVQQFSANTLFITFHLPLKALKAAPNAILLEHAAFIYGSLHSSDDYPMATVAHVARICSSSIATVEHQLISAFQMQHPELPIPPITGRERTVLTLRQAGKSRATIAADLVISPNTVKTHLQNLHHKIGGDDLWQMVARAREMGLFHYQQC
jgi:DNA-binding NarL/FixJ family response regulator